MTRFAESLFLATRDVIQDFGGLAFPAQLVLCSSPLKDSGKSIISNLWSSKRHQCVTGMAEPDAFWRTWRESVDEAMEIILVDKPISRQILLDMARERFGNMVKAVVDTEQGVMAIGGGLHADEESYLLERGSLQENLWGINLHPRRNLPELVEFDSVINIRPRQDNLSRYVEEPSIRDRVVEIVGRLVH